MLRNSPRRRQVNVRLSEQEKSRLEAVAQRRGLRSAADLLRQAALAELTEPRSYTVLIHPADADETGYWAEVPALPGCVTQGETIDEVLVNVQDAIRVYLAMCIRHGQPVPVEKPTRRKTIRGIVSVEAPV